MPGGTQFQVKHPLMNRWCDSEKLTRPGDNNGLRHQRAEAVSSASRRSASGTYGLMPLVLKCTAGGAFILRCSRPAPLHVACAVQHVTPRARRISTPKAAEALASLGATWDATNGKSVSTDEAGETQLLSSPSGISLSLSLACARTRARKRAQTAVAE
jgi:hypothetical protein